MFFRQWLLIIFLIIPVQVYAAIYVYEDEQGVRHYTNTPTSSRYKLATLRRLNTPPPGNLGSNSPSGLRRTSIVRGDSTAFDRHIAKAADTYMVDPLLIKAIIKAESGFDPSATSRKGAQGLMQLMPETARDMKVWNPYSASQNIDGGTRYFKKLLDDYDGDLVRSLAAYNAGPGKVAKKGPLPRIQETLKYVQRVTGYYRSYQQKNSAGSSHRISLQELVTVN